MRKKTSFLLFLVLILGYSLFLNANFVIAQADPCAAHCADPLNVPSPPGKTCICNPLNAPDFETLIGNVINFIFMIATVVAPLMILIAAFLFMTSGGNPDKVNRAKDIIVYTAIGYAIILFAWGLVSLLKDILGQ